MSVSLSLSGRQKAQIALITTAAVALFFIVRRLPTGTNLSHMDFRMTGGNSIEFCDPLNPQFIPVVTVRSPVTMKVDAGPRVLGVGGAGRAVIQLFTSSGKPLTPDDLLVTHTRKLHLLVIDPTLQDYQHVHPEWDTTIREWRFTFSPRYAGLYRLFADFTPVATGRGLYASADLMVARGADPLPPPPVPAWTYEADGYLFELRPAGLPIRAGRPVELVFMITRSGGGVVPMESVMGAYAHLVAFDEARSGFAHLHPLQTDLAQRPDQVRPTLSFKVTIPKPGRYVIWSQVKIDGRERFAPFWFEVAP
jgi:hypothetical protein